MLMSTRGSKKTDPAISGLLPRPRGGIATQGLIQHLYLYTAAGVRSFRKGNIGPVLIDIKRSMAEAGYQGIILNEEDDWVYYSPMSWHPGGKKALWMEGLGGSNGHQIRVRKVELLDYQPRPTVPARRTPDEISYGLRGDLAAESLWHTHGMDIEEKIAGKFSGYIVYVRQGQMPAPALIGFIQDSYVNFNDDEVTFYNGYEKSRFSFVGESVYEADLVMSGPQQGEMKSSGHLLASLVHPAAPPPV